MFPTWRVTNVVTQTW